MNQVAGASPAQESSRGLVGAAFIGTLLLALGLRLVVATALPTLAWPDEIFQTMEQAHRLVFGYGIVPWEFRLGARSWLFPGLLAAVMELGRPFGGQGYLRAVQVALACLSLIPIAVVFSWAYRRHGMLAALVASIAATTSFELVYFSTRALTEVAAAHVVVAALYMSSVDNPRRRQLLLSGVAFGLAAVLRFHLTPAIIASLALSCGRSPSRWRLVLAGMAVPVMGAGLLDLVTWSGFLSSFVLNFRYNLVEGNSTSYGVEPWYWYMTRIVDIGSWSVIVVLGLAAVGGIRQRVAAVFAAVALLTHTLLAHKEYRFIYPVIVVVVLLASQGLAEVCARFPARNRVSRVIAVGMAVLVWTAISGWRASRFTTDSSNSLARDGHSMWHVSRDSLMGMTALGADEGVCGVGLVDVSWAGTGGFTYLHRNIPVYLIVEPWMLVPTIPAFNAALVPIELSSDIPGYRVEKCWKTECIVKRQGPCIDIGAEKINDALARVGA